MYLIAFLGKWTIKNKISFFKFELLVPVFKAFKQQTKSSNSIDITIQEIRITPQG